MKDANLHIDAYNEFRRYLDILYPELLEHKIVSLSAGYPEPGQFPLPLNILRDLANDINGVEIPRPGYGWNFGYTPMKEELLKLENELHGTHYSMENICMTAGATYAFNRIAETIFLPQYKCSKLMVVAPTYYRMLMRPRYYADIYSVCGSAENDFQITPQEIIDNLTEDTKAVFIANPTNPTYLYYDNSFFEELIPILEKKEVYLIIDESGDAFHVGDNYSRLRRFPPCIQSDYVIRIVTASKKYLLAEYRIGYVLGGKQFMGNKQEGFIKEVGDDIGNAPLATNRALLSIAQSERALLGPKTDDPNIIEFDKCMRNNNIKMDHLKAIALQYLRDCPAVKSIICPDCNFNITFQTIKGKYKSDMQLFIELLHKGVSIVPCSGFGLAPEDMYFRITYGIEESELRDGMRILTEYLNSALL